MPLLTEIANALGCARDAVTGDFSGYVIKDHCPQPAPKTILLLESPHTEEVRERHPLAGQAGKKVTNALRCNESIRGILDRLDGANQDSNGNEAIGRILRRDQQQTLRLGLMNASQLPLQIKAHCDCEGAHHDCNWQRYGELLCFLQAVRECPKLLLDRNRLRARNRASGTYNVLLDDLKLRLQALPSDALVVPCGQVARDFVTAATHPERGYQRTARICQREIPHPSARGNWYGMRGVEELVDTIRKRAAGN